MKDKYLKIKELVNRILYAIKYDYKDWKENVWAREFDEYDCCNGRECGCEGRTVRQNYIYPREY